MAMGALPPLRAALGTWHQEVVCGVLLCCRRVQGRCCAGLCCVPSTVHHIPPHIAAPHDASFVGTAEYTAPETLAGHPPTPAVDLWALGCVVYQMLTGTPPFKGPTEFATFERITNGEFALPSDIDAMYKDAVDLIKQLLVADAGTRLGSDSMAALQAHPLFTGIDWGVDGSALWEGEPVEFVPPRPSSPTAEASDWELLSLQSLAEALPIPRYEYEPNPAFFAGQNESSSTEEE